MAYEAFDRLLALLAQTFTSTFLTRLVTPNGDSAMDDTNNAVRVTIVSGSSAGTEYTEGDTDASISGGAVMWEDASDTLRPVNVNKPLPVGTPITSTAASLTNANDTCTHTVPPSHNTIVIVAVSGATNIGNCDLEASYDGGSTWVSATAYTVLNSGYQVGQAQSTPLTGTGLTSRWMMANQNYTHVRVKCTSAGTGACAYTIYSAGLIGGAHVLTSALPSGTNFMGYVGISAVSGGSWYTEDSAHSSGDTGTYVLGVRRDADTTSAADGDYHSLHTDSLGRVKVGLGSSQTSTTSWTDATALNTTSTITSDAAGMNTLGIQAVMTGSPSTGIMYLQGSVDGTTWFELPATYVLTGVVDTLGLTLYSGDSLWVVNVSGIKYLRLKLTEQISAGGTATIKTYLTAGPATSYITQTPNVNTEISAAATPADNLSNNTSMGQVMVRPLLYDGSTWDRMKGDSTDGMLVNLGSNNDVNLIVGQTGVAAGAGDISATTQRVAQAGSGTTATTSVGGSASSVQLLAANSSRRGATIYNDSSALLYVKLGTTASSTSFAALLLGNGSGVGGYFEVPAWYTGRIDGIWASATGNARITELT